MAVALVGATVLSCTGCNYQDVPDLDAPKLELELQLSPTYCTGLWHMPNPKFPGSLSWGVYASLVKTDDGSELPPLSGATILVDKLPDAQASIDSQGVIVGVLPLSERGTYRISGVIVRSEAKDDYSLSLAYDFEVGPEGSDIECEGDAADAETIQQGIRVSPHVSF